MAAEYYKFASDQGHPEAKLNHARCLRLLGRWQPPDRSSKPVSHPTSLDRLSEMFRGFLDNPDPQDSDARRLLSCFERARASTPIPVISTSLDLEWVQDPIRSGDSSVVTFALDSQSHLTAVKTALSPDHADLIRREAAILKTLKHPLILELREDISETIGRSSAIVSEFAGNGSLANHLPPTNYPLTGANRITKIVVGIAFAMRYLHSRGVIHRDFKPDNILLDWDWNVRIADFGESTLADNPDIPSPTHPHPIHNWPSISSCYLAPECYNNCYLPASDVFSFGLILYELVTGQSAFPTELTPEQIACMVAIDNDRPDIPEFVLPATRELIEDCWVEKPRDRPSFKEIVDRLAEMNFKVMLNVNSLKLSAFVKRIEEEEAGNAAVL
jgi:serine/threonine protein kinase